MSVEKVVSPVAPIFYLNTIAAFIRCYLFLCKVVEHVDNSVDQVFKEWETGDGKSKFQGRNRNASASRVSRPHGTLYLGLLRISHTKEAISWFAV
jgi:hypothetical protein